MVLDMDKFEELQVESWLYYINRECPEDRTNCDCWKPKERYF